ncbi:DUF1622 domain-containing protein [Entomospira entomophila]|uniref:DUF1622 domain-containing protein n=1 Tax=Entomospira entomophila TaxID=2719988 RepID=A0A968G8A5_9SPIO|nr:DUF1622 domain-containing protein [Entomospira entomophilus]NIZ40398.1 DUF1622 domain-containing protein [Entomospira entomophilus]WDI35957.1 DUF1622 domain-containing protein [Entomospira entomophilus]
MLQYTNLLSLLTHITNLISIFILTYGILLSFIKLIQSELARFTHREKIAVRQQIRAYLGSYILLSLEFLIAADIIGTIQHPSWEEILLLVGIVIIRTFIAFFLEKEMKSTSTE